MSKLRVGDYVNIPNTTYQNGQIDEDRGPLGPGGARIFRVRIPDKPAPTYIELREDQLELQHPGAKLSMLRRKEIQAKTIDQSCDTRCFSTGNNLDASRHRKKAKRLSSKRVRRLIKKEADGQLED